MNGEKALSVKPAPLRVGLALLGILLLAAGALSLGGGPDAAVACEGARAEWSASDPPVNLTHVFCGEVKADGRAVGFHARPGGVDPETARVVEIEDGPNAEGVYTARIQVRPPGGSWARADDKFSSLFPDSLSVEEVVQAILTAYRDSGTRQGKWRGDSGLGFTIEGWLLPGEEKINTAYPIYR